jgi:hypothetical protein
LAELKVAMSKGESYVGFIKDTREGALRGTDDGQTETLQILGCSPLFQYKVEPTGADSPSQNGQVEHYNDTVATIVRTLLYGANLPAKYWSVAAVHAVYLMNRRVHNVIGMTPYEAWYNQKLDLSRLKVFGSRVSVKVTGKRRSKLDRHDFTGIFVGYTATDENIRYIDLDTLGCKFRWNSGQNSRIPFRFGDFAPGTTECLYENSGFLQCLFIMSLSRTGRFARPPHCEACLGPLERAYL